MDLLITSLIEKKYLRLYATFCNTDGFPKQHRCAATLYLLSCFARKNLIRITYLVEAPAHRDGYVGSINAVDKNYLKIIIILIKTPHTPTWRSYLHKKESMHSVKE